MNDRIRELVQTAFDTASYPESQQYRIEPNAAFCQKFAELLIRECADACYDHKDVERFGIYPIRVAMVTKACSENIKKHFGIRE